MELAAFLANIAHESGHLFYTEEIDGHKLDYTVAQQPYLASKGKNYFGRGPMQLSYTFNYGPASEYIFGDK